MYSFENGFCGRASSTNLSSLVVIDAPNLEIAASDSPLLSPAEMGCQNGPDALHRIGIVQRLANLGHRVTSRNVKAEDELAETLESAYAVGLPICLGRDAHLTATMIEAMGSKAIGAKAMGVPHTERSVYVLKLGGKVTSALQTLQPDHLRYLDNIRTHALSESSLTWPQCLKTVTEFLNRVAANQGVLHLSIDPSFMTRDAAPATPHASRGHVSAVQALQLMQLIAATRLIASIDIIGFNPALDMGSKTAHLLVSLLEECLSSSKATGC